MNFNIIIFLLITASCVYSSSIQKPVMRIMGEQVSISFKEDTPANQIKRCACGAGAFCCCIGFVNFLFCESICYGLFEKHTIANRCQDLADCSKNLAEKNWNYAKHGRYKIGLSDKHNIESKQKTVFNKSVMQTRKSQNKQDA